MFYAGRRDNSPCCLVRRPYPKQGRRRSSRLVFAFFFAIFALVVASLENSRLKREQTKAVEAAHELSQGIPYNGSSDSELLDSLKSVSEYLAAKSSLADRIAAGNLLDNVSPLSDSDVLGGSMQHMVENLRETVQTQDERDRLHDSVMKLLEEVSDVSAGDLTVHAEVGPDVTGAIAGRVQFDDAKSADADQTGQGHNASCRHIGRFDKRNDRTARPRKLCPGIADNADDRRHRQHGRTDTRSFRECRTLGKGRRRIAQQCTLRHTRPQPTTSTR